MIAGRLSSAALMLCGLAGVLVPDQVAEALHLPASSGRGNAEVRAGLGGTYLALGAWALFSGKPAARTAVGVTWLGAAGARLMNYVHWYGNERLHSQLSNVTPEEYEQAYYASTTGSPSGDAANKKTA